MKLWLPAAFYRHEFHLHWWGLIRRCCIIQCVISNHQSKDSFILKKKECLLTTSPPAATLGKNIVHSLFINLDKRGMMFTSDGISVDLYLGKRFRFLSRFSCLRVKTAYLSDREENFLASTQRHVSLSPCTLHSWGFENTLPSRSIFVLTWIWYAASLEDSFSFGSSHLSGSVWSPPSFSMI